MTSALQSYIEGLVGGQFTVQLSTVTVNTSSTKLVANNFERMALMLINTGSTNAAVLPSMAVSSTNGVILNANGGSMTLNAHDDLALVGWEWDGITASSSTTFTVMEILRYSASNESKG